MQQPLRHGFTVLLRDRDYTNLATVSALKERGWLASLAVTSAVFVLTIRSDDAIAVRADDATAE